MRTERIVGLLFLFGAAVVLAPVETAIVLDAITTPSRKVIYRDHPKPFPIKTLPEKTVIVEKEVGLIRTAGREIKTVIVNFYKWIY